MRNKERAQIHQKIETELQEFLETDGIDLTPTQKYQVRRNKILYRLHQEGENDRGLEQEFKLPPHDVDTIFKVTALGKKGDT